MKSHRGLSSAVGAVFLIIVLTTGMTYVSTSISTVGNFSEQVIVQDTHRIEKEKEAFEITSIDTSTGTLNAVLQNTGQIPVKITRFYLDEKGIVDVVQKIEVNAAIPIGGTVKLTDYVSFPVDSTKGYKLKFLTSRGFDHTYFVNSSNQQNLDLQLHALPQTVPTGFETTVLFSVHNNATDNNILMNLTPVIQVVPNDINTIVAQIGTVEPEFYPSLKPGETTTFKWVYSINGDTGDYAEFTTSLLNGYPNNEETSRVTVTEVLLASEAVTSFTSQGFTPLSSQTSDLVLHQENVLEPPSWLQMDQKLADAIGQSISLDATIPIFATNNGTEVEISAGKWNTTMVYYSDPFPDILATSMDIEGGLVFHFEDGGGGIDGNEDNSFDCVSEASKSKYANYEDGMSVNNWEEYGGPHNSGSYTFDGSSGFFSVQKSKCSEVKTDTATISGRFKADSAGSGEDYIYWAGRDDGATEQRFSVKINTVGDVVFDFETTNNDETICTTLSTDYRDDTWHHFVGVRDGDFSCRLYIDGSLADEPIDGSGGNADVGIDDPVVIGGRLITKGANPSAGDFFQGSLDDIMYWQNFAMTAPQITDLYNANYGDHAHEVTFTFSRTDNEGNFLTTLTNDISYPMNFSDGKRDNEFLNSFIYSTALQPIVTIGAQERLKFEMLFVDFTEALKMTLRIDDNSLSESTRLLLPELSASFSPFSIYDNDSLLTVGVTSSGPFGAWITKDGSRAILTSTTTQESYAGIIRSVNGTEVSETQDGVFIADGEKVDLVFYRPRSEPNSCWNDVPVICDEVGIMPPGLYDGKVLMIGYNDEGNENTWKIDLGKITVNE